MNQTETLNERQMSPAELIDESNTRFYERFPFPWRPAKFDFLVDPDFQTVMFNQNIGDWEGHTLPEKPSIWVAGCGTNSALITALTFPKATVLGSDLSSESLGLCASSAKELGVTNLELRRESINGVPYKEQFDYIICNGVIHHNADPAATLRKLVGALKRDGVMELMVYNLYERLATTAFGNAIKLLASNDPAPDLDRDILRAKQVIADFQVTNFAMVTKGNIDEYPECLLADTFIQPNEGSFTLDTFEELGNVCGLEVLHPACDHFDNITTDTPWNLSFTNPVLQRDYYALPDVRRWRITNHVLFERSPQLWFYFQRQDSRRPRRSEQTICAEFLKQKFVRAGTLQRSYIRNAEGSYVLSTTQLAYPLATPKGDAGAIYKAVDGQKTMEQIMTQLGQPATFQHVNKVRLQLTTTAHPYLRALPKLNGNRNSPADVFKRTNAELNLKKLKEIKPKPVSHV